MENPDNLFTDEVLSKELQQFLMLAKGEIKLSVKEANQAVQTLTKTFMSMVKDVHEIQIIASQMKDSPDSEHARQEIIKCCDEYLNKVQSGTVGFQFYDKMTQRLSHTSSNITRLIKLNEKPENLSDNTQWQNLKNEIEASYNMEEDRALYQSLIQGESIQQAIKVADKVEKQREKTGNIELF